MATLDTENSSSERLCNLVKDQDLKTLSRTYDPYFDLHDNEDIFELFDIKQSLPEDAFPGRLVWKTTRDLPIELKKGIISVYSKYFIC